MKKITKKIITPIIVILMMIGILPISINTIKADDPINHTVTFNVNGGTKHETLWPESDSIELPEGNYILQFNISSNLKTSIFLLGNSDYDIAIAVGALAPQGYTAESIEVIKNDTSTKYDDSFKIESNFALDSDITIKFNWKEAVTVSFDTGDSDTLIDYQVIEPGSTATKPTTTPVSNVESLTFYNWYEVNPEEMIASDFNTAGFNFEKQLNEDITLYAAYKGVLDIYAYNLNESAMGSGGKFTYNSIFNPGTSQESLVNAEAIAGSTFELIAYPREGYEFVGWSTSDSIDDIISSEDEYEYKFTEHASIYALFDIEKHNVTFDPNGGTMSDPQLVRVIDGEKVNKPNDPTKAPTVFAYWADEEGNEFDFDSEITRDITLTAKYKYLVAARVYDKESEAPINFNILKLNDGTAAANVAENIVEGKNYKLEIDVPDGYDFLGWAPSDNLDEILSTETIYSGTMGESIIRLYAIIKAQKCDVTFDPNNGENTTTTTVNKNTKVTKPDNPEKNDLVFDAWVDEEGNEFDFDTKITEDITLTAQYLVKVVAKLHDQTNNATVETNNLKYNDGQAKANILDSVIEGTDLKFEAILPEGYEFVKWSNDTAGTEELGTDVVYETTASENNLDLVGIIKVQEFTITFDPNNGDDLEEISVLYNNKVTKPDNPEKNDLVFDAWVDEEGNEFDFDTKITEDITLTAQYKGELYLNTYDLFDNRPNYGGGIETTGYYKEIPTATGYAYEVIEGAEITVKALPGDGNEFVGWGDGLNEYEDIISEDEEYTFTFTGNKNLTAVFDAYKPDIIVHWSSIDGVDLMDPVVLEDIKPGTTLYDAFYENGLSFSDPVFSKEGYVPADYKTPEPITAYTDNWDLYSNSFDEDELVGSEDIHIYEIMDIILATVDIQVEELVCGVVTETPDENDDSSQTNPPVVTISEHVSLDKDDDWIAAFWIIDKDDYRNFVGTFEGGKEYAVYVELKTDFGYCVGEETEFTSNGEVLKKQINYYYPIIYLGIEAVHDFDDWKVVKEPTFTEEGLKERTCKHCGEKEEEIIAKKEKEIYTLTFDLDGGTYNGQSTYVVEYEEDTIITLPKPEKKGYTFDYWQGSKYYAGDEYKVTEDHNFKAIWKKDEPKPTPTPTPTPGRIIPNTAAK